MMVNLRLTFSNGRMRKIWEPRLWLLLRWKAQETKSCRNIRQ